MSQLQVEHQRFVVGQAPDLEHARRVYQYLRNRGVDPNDIRLRATAAELADQPTHDLAARDQVDSLAADLARREAEAGALIGALAGAAIGAGGGLLATAGNISGNLALFLAIVFGFAGLGAWVAASLCAARSMGYDDTLELMVDEGDGSAWIAVRVRDELHADHIRALLEFEGLALVEEHTAETLGVHTVRW